MLYTRYTGEFNMDASTLLREVDTFFSDRSLSEEVRTKRLQSQCIKASQVHLL